MQGECDVKKGYSAAEFALRLRRLADFLEHGEGFAIKFAGEKVFVPEDAEFNIEFERNDSEVELEFEIKWSND